MRAAKTLPTLNGMGRRAALLAVSSSSKSHAEMASESMKHLGQGNLLYSRGAFWLWRGTGVWLRCEDREIKQEIHSAVGNSQLTKSKVDSVLDLIKTETFRRDDILNSGSDCINCPNGELHFDGTDWRLRPHNRDAFLTSQIPVRYDPGASAPTFERFLSEVFQDDVDATEKSRLVYELLGYTVHPTCRYEKFVLLIGGGANGKSVLMRVVEGLCGHGNVSAVAPSHFDNRFQRAHLSGKLANLVTELAEGGIIADAPLKAIVSGEVSTAEHKHQAPFEFRPHCTCWFGTNHMPHTRDFSQALFRRAIILGFKNRFDGSRCDPGLAGKLLTELPGILNLALAHYKRVIRDGSFTECESSQELKRDWSLEADQVGQFIEERCALNATGRITSALLYANYKDWVQEVGVNRPLSRKPFTGRLERHGVKPVRGTGGTRVLEGIELRLPTSDVSDVFSEMPEEFSFGDEIDEA